MKKIQKIKHSLRVVVDFGRFFLPGCFVAVLQKTVSMMQYMWDIPEGLSSSTSYGNHYHNNTCEYVHLHLIILFYKIFPKSTLNTLFKDTMSCSIYAALLFLGYRSNIFLMSSLSAWNASTSTTTGMKVTRS